MIVVKIFSGLGNQMFQYAAGLAAATSLRTDLRLDLSWFDIPEKMVRAKRNFELDKFPNINVHIADKKICAQTGYVDDFDFSIAGKIRRRMHHCSRLLVPKSSYITDDSNKLLIEALQNGKDYYLDGYWQSEVYFKDWADQVLNTFEFPEFKCKKNMDFAKILSKQENSVAVHVRRGDYVRSPQDAKLFGKICTADYYKKAIAEIEKRIKAPSYIVFSDEPQWAAENLNLPETTVFVDWNNNGNGFRDMQLMSSCKHNIIANSSFSWWGAWLNQNPDKIIIAPARWTNDKSIKTERIIPAEWIRIPI
jgi:hypothetical protein